MALSILCAQGNTVVIWESPHNGAYPLNPLFLQRIKPGPRARYHLRPRPPSVELITKAHCLKPFVPFDRMGSCMADKASDRLATTQSAIQL